MGLCLQFAFKAGLSRVKNAQGDLPYLDLMVGESDDHIARELEKHDSDRPPDSVQGEQFVPTCEW